MDFLVGDSSSQTESEVAAIQVPMLSNAGIWGNSSLNDAISWNTANL